MELTKPFGTKDGTSWTILTHLGTGHITGVVLPPSPTRSIVALQICARFFFRDEKKTTHGYLLFYEGIKTNRREE